MKAALFVLITATVLANPAFALNRCVDSNGKVNYTDQPCEANQKSGAVNLSGVGKSDRPTVARDDARFTTSNRTAAIQAYLAKTEADRAHEKEQTRQNRASGLNGAGSQPGQTAGNLPAQTLGGVELTSEMQKEIDRLSKQLGAARALVNGGAGTTK